MSTSLMTAFTSCRDAVVALRWYRVFFVRAGWAVENQVGLRPALDEAAQQCSLPQQVLLSCYLIQCLRSYFICQRPHHGTSSSLRPEAPCPQNQLDYTTFFSDLHPLFAFFPPVWYNG